MNTYIFFFTDGSFKTAQAESMQFAHAGLSESELKNLDHMTRIYSGETIESIIKSFESKTGWVRANLV